MENINTYYIRQGILRALSDAHGPADFERIMRHVELCDQESALVLCQWRDMECNGYLEAVAGSDGKYLRLTAKGGRQLSFNPADADPYIWGIRAMR